MSGWVACTVQSLVDQGQAEVKTGPFGTQLPASVYVENGIPVINVRNIGFGDIRSEKLEYISEGTAQRLSSHLLKPNDIVFGRKGAVERHAFIKKAHDRWFQGSDCLRLRVSGETADPRFVSYCFLIEAHKTWMMNQCSHGATMASLNQDIVKRIPLRLPPLETQRKIAAILSTYDDLIENNTRRIKILEEMAQAIYREWFVNFRFPGHEQVRMVDSSLGRVPEGWAVLPVTEAVEINPRTKVPKEGEKPFVPMGCLSNGSMLITGVETRGGNSGSKFKNSDTLFARITPCLENGKTGYVQFLLGAGTTAFGSTEFIVLRSHSLCPEYVYLMARSSEFRDNAIKSMSGATGRQRVSEKCFEQFFIAQPDVATLESFSKIAAQIFKQIFVLANKSQNLRQTRDLLLPKLISGEIDIAPLNNPLPETTP